MEYLAENQNAAFDREYHSKDELNWKANLINKRFPSGSPKLLDLGGGNGKFLDALLESVPHAEGVLVDISEYLLEKNRSHPRKRVERADLTRLDDLFSAHSFDVITLNWVLHHMVGNNYSSCISEADSVLKAAARLLTEDGVLLVAENLFDGPKGSDLPSRIVYKITRLGGPMVKLTSRFFNTAGVGVCFHSELAWRNIFARNGFRVGDFFYGSVWNDRGFRRLMLSLLFIRQRRHGHFLLEIDGGKGTPGNSSSLRQF